MPEDLVLAARREEIDWVDSEGVHEIVPLQECKDVGKKPLDLIRVDTDESVDPTRKKIRSRLCAREYKTKKQGRSCEGACLNYDVGEFVEQRETIEVETPQRHQQSTFPRDSPETSFTSDFPQRIVRSMGEDKVGRLIKGMYGTQYVSHIWQLDYVNLICGEFGGFRRCKHSLALFLSPNQDVRVAVRGDDFVCLSDDDSNISTVFSNPNTQRMTREHLMWRFRREQPSVVEPCV